ncbi:MAG: DUF4352 domain-containing protein [Streptococcaceae bacterium]|jgi:hypothetical protein|nr:DUF4352 domain-containing protein [Streptococcaceae bacterium]
MKLAKMLTVGAVSAAALFALTGCFGFGKTATIKVDSKEVVISSDKKANDGNVYVDMTLEVTNETKSTLKDFSSYEMALYDSNNNKISPESIYSSDSTNINSLSKSSDLQAGKTAKGDVIFQVEKGKKYTLHYTPMDSSYKKLKDVEVAVDMSKISDNSANLKTMAGNYIDAVFLGKTDVKSNLKNDLNSEGAQFKSDFTKDLISNFKDETITVSSSDAQTIVSSFMATNAAKSKGTFAIKEMYSDYAVVTVKPQTINLDDLDLSNEASDWISANSGKYDDYDKGMAAFSKYILSKMPTEIAKLSAKDPNYVPTDGYEMILKKGTDGKWTFDSDTGTDNYDFKDLQQAFSSDIVGNN